MRRLHSSGGDPGPRFRRALGCACALAGVGMFALVGTSQLTATAEPSAGTCDLPPSISQQDGNEWLSCLSVGLTLDGLPELGETAELTATVEAAVDLDRTEIRFDLPETFEWVHPPGGTSKERALRAGQTVRLTGEVRAVEPGAAQFTARAEAPHDGHVEAGADSVFVTVGSGDSPTVKGIPRPESAGRDDGGLPVRQLAAKPESTPQTDLEPQSVAPDRTADREPCDANAIGSWGYTNEAGDWVDQMNIQVEVWDADAAGGNDRLASGVTKADGTFDLCYDSVDADEAGNVDVYVRFSTTNSLWSVQYTDTDDVLAWVSETTNDVVAGQTVDVGALTTGDAELNRGLDAYDSTNSVWLWIPKSGDNLCWDQNHTECETLTVFWAPDSTDGTYYTSNTVHLAADDPNAEILVGHEVGHFVMDDVFDKDYPDTPNCSPHGVTATSSTGCAWSEGWAEWFPATVFDDPFFRWPNGASVDLENQTWDTEGWDDGDAVEGRVAGAMLDLADDTADGEDQYGEGNDNLWHTFTNHHSKVFSEFWADRGADGFDVGAGPLGSLYQTTIDYRAVLD